jgi:hypothetical protein
MCSRAKKCLNKRQFILTLIYKDIDSIESKVENERVKNLKQVSSCSFLTKK